MLKEFLGEVPVGVSNRHVHIAQPDLERLFGPGHTLTVVKPLSQPGQFASEELVTLVGPKRSIDRVRILGEIRQRTQIEISRTDSFVLGIEPPLRDSGDLGGSAGIKLVGPYGELTLDQGVIIARRHIHMTNRDAREFGVVDKELVDVLVEGKRRLIISEALIRVDDDYLLEMHIDTDEANAGFVGNGQMVKVYKRG